MVSTPSKVTSARSPPFRSAKSTTRMSLGSRPSKEKLTGPEPAQLEKKWSPVRARTSLTSPVSVLFQPVTLVNEKVAPPPMSTLISTWSPQLPISMPTNPLVPSKVPA
jgi:hypothetical protein